MIYLNIVYSHCNLAEKDKVELVQRIVIWGKLWWCIVSSIVVHQRNWHCYSIYWNYAL